MNLVCKRLCTYKHSGLGGKLHYRVPRQAFLPTPTERIYHKQLFRRYQNKMHYHLWTLWSKSKQERPPICTRVQCIWRSLQSPVPGGETCKMNDYIVNKTQISSAHIQLHCHQLFSISSLQLRTCLIRHLWPTVRIQEYSRFPRRFSRTLIYGVPQTSGLQIPPRSASQPNCQKHASHSASDSPCTSSTILHC